ncbi:MAG: hypothetical protein D6798_19680 [Deltaproteobacteria bacterium]|nr:MAG: hypothetical protein D6798_19680 [Deltaproteobacteria bacterium]
MTPLGDPRRARIAGGLGLLVLLAIAGGVALMVARDPDHRVARARDALDAHDLAAAEAEYRRALALDPAHLGALEGLGWTYLLAGQRAAARSSFERCVDLDDRAPGCLRGLAAVAMAEGDMARARQLLRRGMEVAPDDPGIQSSMGLLELASGEVDSAASRYESLVARFPDRAEYAVGLVEARLQQGRLDEALALVDEALAQEGTPRRYVATLHLLRARVLVASVAGRVDPERCAETAPPLLAWLDSAEESVAASQATGVAMPQVAVVRRSVGRARGLIEDACPGGTAEAVPRTGTAPSGPDRK